MGDNVEYLEMPRHPFLIEWSYGLRRAKLCTLWEPWVGFTAKAKSPNIQSELSEWRDVCRFAGLSFLFPAGSFRRHRPSDYGRADSYWRLLRLESWGPLPQLAHAFFLRWRRAFNRLSRGSAFDARRLLKPWLTRALDPRHARLWHWTFMGDNVEYLEV